MTTSPSSSAKQAQEALGVRLRELRRDTGLTGRALAAALGWHFTRVSKLEHGVQAPTDADILAALETPTASIEVTRPQEIELYARMFDRLLAAAVHGKAARALITKALEELG